MFLLRNRKIIFELFSIPLLSAALVYTLCCCPFNETLPINGLKWQLPNKRKFSLQSLNIYLVIKFGYVNFVEHFKLIGM